MTRHMLIMMLCCSIPLGLIFLLPYLGLTISSGVLFFFVILLCPLMHFLLMGKLGHSEKSHSEEHEEPRQVA